MKVALDEHIPPAMTRAFEGFATVRQFQRLIGGIKIVKSSDYNPRITDGDYIKGSDVPWIKRFYEDGGRFIISGDRKMLFRPHERLALVEAKMTVFFFGERWSDLKFFRQCSLLMACWPLIAAKIKTSKPGTARFWRIPTSWADDAKLQPLSTKDQRLVRIERQQAARKMPARGRRKRSPVPDQAELFDDIKEGQASKRKRRERGRSACP